MSLISAYDNIVNVASTEIPDMDRIEPGDPEMSYLVWKIEGRSGITGSRMPLGGVLPNSQIQTIVSWVEAGANP
jgi:hypothetical protein